MSQALSERTITLVKATLPALEAHGLDIVREMYSRMFQKPEIRDLFNQSHHEENGSQPRALTGAILAYAANIDNLGVLAAAVERIAQKHVGLQILPEHYPTSATPCWAPSPMYWARPQPRKSSTPRARPTASWPIS